VAFGFKYDIAPAQELGLATAWVNRHGEPPPGDARPDHELSDLWPLAHVA
jgi:2-haloacid dehalogenase